MAIAFCSGCGHHIEFHDKDGCHQRRRLFIGSSRCRCKIRPFIDEVYQK